MKKATDVFLQGKQILKQSGIQSYSFDTACLFEHCFNISRHQLLLNPNTPLDATEFLELCKKYANGYPLQYILKSWQFMDCEFYVDENVLIPRADTETLVEYVLTLNVKTDILDMCTGSGCIGVSLAKALPNSNITLCDISDSALDIATKNAKQNNVDVKIQKADLLNGYGQYFKKSSFDVIVSNPPYIKSVDMQTLDKYVKHEPTLALDGGEDGTDFYKALIVLWKDALKPGGRLVLEAGYDTKDDIIALFMECGYADIAIKKDLNGIVRAISGKNS